MTTTRVHPVRIDGILYYPLESASQLPRAFGDAEHFLRDEVQTRFTRVADETWVVHRADRPGSTGVLVRNSPESFIYSAAASAESGFPGWRIEPQQVTWSQFLNFYRPGGDGWPAEQA